MIGLYKQQHNTLVIIGVVLFLCILFLCILIGRPVSYVVAVSDGLQCYWQSDVLLLTWRHSVEKQNWIERYQRQGRQLFLTHTYTQTFGAGIPAGNQTTVAPKGYVGMRTQLHFDELNWVVSRNMQGQIYTPKEGVFLIYRYVPDYSKVVIKVMDKPWYQWQFMEKCYESANRTTDHTNRATNG